MRNKVAAWFIACLCASSAYANAQGTARIEQPDGHVRIYDHVRIRVQDHQRLLITSSDGKGTLVVNKASCTAVENLLRCLPYSAELEQNGATLPLAVQSGTVWLNASGAPQQLRYSSAQLPPRGVLMALVTRRGTHVALTGTVDEVMK